MNLFEYKKHIESVLSERIKNLSSAIKFLKNGSRVPMVISATDVGVSGDAYATPYWAKCPIEIAEVFLQKALDEATREQDEGLKRIQEWEAIINK